MEKVVLFLDYANINRSSLDLNYQLDYTDLAKYLSEYRFLIDSFAYFPIDPRNEHGFDLDKQNLWLGGYLVKEKIGQISGDTYKCNMDVEMTMDILKIAYQVKPDTMIIASGDVDFIPLILELRKMGIRVEIAAFKTCASKELIVKCSGFIDLDLYYDEFINNKGIDDGSDVNNLIDQEENETFQDESFEVEENENESSSLENIEES